MSAITPYYFQAVRAKFQATLSEREKNEFKVTTLQDLEQAIAAIQDEHASKRKLRGMHRLEVFLEGMKEFDKVVQVFLNSSPILGLIWGPMKYLLQVACTFAEAFDILLDAYQSIGEQIPLLSQYEALFRQKPEMARALTLMYEDILVFHQKAMGYFKQRMWRKFFHSLWRSFDAEYATILGNLQRHRRLIESQASISQFEEIVRIQDHARETLKIARENEKQTRLRSVHDWLSPADCEGDQERLSNLRKANIGSGRWLTGLGKFQAWFHPQFCATPMLWLNGIPGAGKSVLASLVVEESRKLKDTMVIFFYCRYGDTSRNTFAAVVRGLLAQLVHHDDAVLAYLHERYSKTGHTAWTSNALAKEVLGPALKNSNKLYVIIDGIDECARDERKEIVSSLESLRDSLPDDDDSLRCMFFGQDDSAARKDFSKMVSLKVTEEMLRKDIRSYARSKSSIIGSKFDLSHERQMYIEDLITRKADGMFLFARLMSAHLNNQTSLEDLEKELSPQQFPGGPMRLDEVYERIISRLFNESVVQLRRDVKMLLGWLVCAKRPLKWREIQGVKSVNLEDGTMDWFERKFRVNSKDLCGSLVEIYTDGTVSLVHHTARRHLIDNKIIDLAKVELSVALLCVGYLSLPSFDPNIDVLDFRMYLHQGHYAFFEYAFAYWARHIERAVISHKDGPVEELQELAEALEVFIDLHWIGRPRTTLPPKSIMESVRILERNQNVEKVAAAMSVAKKHLFAMTPPAPEEDLLSLRILFAKFRDILVEPPPSLVDRVLHQEMYGLDIYRCSRVSCTRFYRGFDVREHQEAHVRKHERSFFCSFPGCLAVDLGYATLKELQRHETEAHGTIDVDEDNDFPELPSQKISFSCDKCNATFTRNHNLKIHMRTHDAAKERNFICATCGKTFARQGDRTRHMSTHQSGKTTFTCGGTLQSGAPWGCGRSFDRADTLSRHYKSQKGRVCKLPLEEEEVAGVGSSNPTISEKE